MRFAALMLAGSAVALGGAMAEARLVAPEVSDNAITDDGFPRTLEEFGFFIHADAQVPSPGVIPYELNTPLYSDGADKLRFLYVPDGAVIEPSGDGLLQFPVGSAIIKTFAFGEGEDRTLIETRVLLNRADGWVALPYRWNDEQTEARLALAGGRIPITTPGGEEISYRIPNKNQCKACHSLDDAVIPIGPKARNLAPELLEQLAASGKLDRAPTVAKAMPRWSDASVGKEPLARAYLDVNCAHCHRPGGGASNSGLDLRWEQDAPFALGVNKPPVAAGRGAGGLLVSIEPGDPDASILVHRMNSNEPGVAMPELGRSTIDEEAVALMRDWIAEMGS
ncbi:hypothetical protein NAP1_01595 [Erythrobacter sp. NAP1]|uniref:SO2930 family diheme c-type cytochrome n=1 Tax=Erythrobacter sp. NAP1 TaxID=237727 RepID=UPI0000686E2D|nr:SO2930 family diheme c-type cytochrome [Erythrobacter sp. NAP1]EAQ29425.1 hypothetical protein NAP1_01595 [Erythrobacter sp. NAP1]